MPARLRDRGDPAAGMDEHPGSLEPLLQVAARPKAAARLEPGDVLVDAMRGRYSVWTRIRVNLRRVPEAERPPQEPPDPDYDPSAEWNPPPSAP